MKTQYKGDGLTARTGCYAVVVGTTTAGTSGRQCATGTTRPTATTTSVSASQLKKAVGRHFNDPAFIRSVLFTVYGKKEVVPGMLVGTGGVPPKACRVTFLLNLSLIEKGVFN